MNLTRRHFVAASAGALIITPCVAGAVTEEAMAIITEFAGGAPTTGGVTLIAPEIAENGNNVPVSFEVDAEPSEIEAVAIFADGNPNAEVATFRFSEMSAFAAAGTRMRLSTTQYVAVVAKMRDGTARMTEAEVKVTIGGCGG